MLQFPFFTMQQLNLDWLLEKFKTILNFMPIDSGNVGDVLQRNADGAEWQPLGSATLDINGMTAKSPVASSDEVPIYDTVAQENKKATVADIVANASSSVTSVNGQTGAVSLSKSDIGLGSVDNVQQYSATNPPPYPVTSVNGQTGTVIIPTGGGAVDSVNGQTGDVTIAKADVGLGNVNNVPQANLYFGSGVQLLTASIDTSLDPSNDTTISSQNIRLAVSEDKRTIRLCGMITITPNTNTGWRTFVLSGADFANLPDGVSYIHCDWTAELYDYTTRLINVHSSGSKVNYRVLDTKKINLYVDITQNIIDSGHDVLIVFTGIPIQIAK